MQHFQAVDAGHHDVEHDDIGCELAGSLDRMRPVRGGLHFPALVAQRHLQQVAEGRLVVDDERADRGSVEPGEAGLVRGSGRGHIHHCGGIPMDSLRADAARAMRESRDTLTASSSLSPRSVLRVRIGP